MVYFLSALLIILIGLCLFFWFSIKNFLQGLTGNIDERKVEKKFENVLLIFCIQKTKDEYLVNSQIFDTSLYLEKNIIGLTYFVQEQDYEKMRRPLVETLIERTGIDPQFIEEYTNDILMGIFPQATVYKMKDGRWIW